MTTEQGFTDQEQNFVTDTMNLSQIILNDRTALENLIARYNNNQFGSSLSDAKLAGLTSTAHLTLAKIQNAVTAFNALLTALGDDVSGEATNLIKMKG